MKTMSPDCSQIGPSASTLLENRYLGQICTKLRPIPFCNYPSKVRFTCTYSVLKDMVHVPSLMAISCGTAVIKAR